MENYVGISDSNLLFKAAEGDRLSEEVLVKRYSRLVRTCARPYYLTGASSEDLIQEGMFGLISAIREYSPDKNASFKTYAKVCIRRRLYSAIKAASRYKHTPLNNYVSLGSPPFDDSYAEPSFNEINQRGPEELVIARERADELLTALAGKLSNFEAEVLSYYLEGLSCSEIASNLNRSVKSVDNAVHRMKLKMAQQLGIGDFRAT